MFSFYRRCIKVNLILEGIYNLKVNRNTVDEKYNVLQFRNSGFLGRFEMSHHDNAYQMTPLFENNYIYIALLKYNT